MKITNSFHTETYVLQKYRNHLVTTDQRDRKLVLKLNYTLYLPVFWKWIIRINGKLSVPWRCISWSRSHSILHWRGFKTPNDILYIFLSVSDGMRLV